MTIQRRKEEVITAIIEDKGLIAGLIDSDWSQNSNYEHPIGYYWRDFERVPPEDAIPGGMDNNGRPIYIGQVLFEDKLIPGKIYENDTTIVYEYGHQERTSTKNIKILCSQYPEKFEWVRTKRDEVGRLTDITDKLLVKAGYEPGYFTYVGRVFAAGETTVGKVICQVVDCLGLIITRDGKDIGVKGEFEILAYNPKFNVTESSDCNPNIEVLWQ